MNNTVKLEVDPSIIERNLDFRVNMCKDEVNDDPLQRLFPRSNPKPDEIPWKAVLPMPGFVVKVKTVEGDKAFINVCHCPDIPAPRDITEDELIELLESEDPTSFTVPMSIGDYHRECDKSGNLATAFDIAINTNFFNKIQEQSLFKEFFLTVIMEAIENKHKLQLDRESNAVILKHRKCFGTLQSHKIQLRPVRSAPKKMIEELPDSSSFGNNFSSDRSQRKSLIEELPDSMSSNTLVQQVEKNENENSSTLNNLQLSVNSKNKVRLIQMPKDGPVKRLIAFISISALSGKELELDVGEDRILVRSPRKKEMIDFFLPIYVDRDKVTAKYLVNTQTLRVDLPTKE